MNKKKILLLVYFLIFIIMNNLLFDSACIIKAIFGIPCPSCGITRAWISLFSGNIKEAFFFHPLFWILIVIFILYMFKEKIDNKVWFFLIGIIIITYVIRMFLYFPNTSPMDYNQNSLISILFNKLF